MALLSPQYYQNQLHRTLTGKYRPHGDVAQADCIIASGFGYRQDGDTITPSASTHQLAAILAQAGHLPKVLSHDLAQAYRQLKPHAEEEIYELFHPEGLSAARLATLFRAYMKSERWEHGLLIAHPHHLPWLDYLCGQQSVSTIVPAGLQVQFDPVSVQPWTRDLQSWQTEIRQRLRQGYDDAYHRQTFEFHH